mmetsp:Transcript_7267/g.17721  ORF Transcript_7267/g.17721 Transcript_7267/m.17721 type:complete len:402 (-) Transcript_7267:145-1350(-)|eukprot:CAMPEP_0197187786 /NCGR_PEP_ID=MMETSP1423-20130617/16566_1 /TAXON_ID=476441 /ORGANISM="Pseudo-nitzschia heimii, Strain UNC1101" /LENGTH=401 /DNA_ID=CAMNT_0042639449 /DNA_START=158 /DNA_END=1363 /DNA_ORIENTATION=-
MSKITATASQPASAHTVVRAADNTMVPIEDGSRIRGGSLSLSASTYSVREMSTSPAVAFSASLDEESRPEELSFEPPTLSPFDAISESSPLKSFSDNTKNQEKNIATKNNRSISLPKIKLKPRPARRSRSTLTRTYKTPSTLAFLMFRSTHSLSQYPETSQEQRKEKPLPAPPIIPQFPVSFTSAPTASTPCTPKTPQQKTICNGSAAAASTPLSSPPQLIASLDSPFSSTTKRSFMTACKTPPMAHERPTLKTPRSANITTRMLPPITRSTDRARDNSSGRMVSVGVVRPISRRLFVTPASNHLPRTSNTTANIHHRLRSATLSGDEDCIPLRHFPGHYNDNSNNYSSSSSSGSIIHGINGAGAIPLSSSGEYSAFSVSSALASTFATIRKTWGSGGTVS